MSLSTNENNQLKQNGIIWPPGGRQQKFLVLNVPGITDHLLTNALSFVSNFCYIKGVRNNKRYFLHIPGVQKHLNVPCKKTIEMERLFKQGTKDGVENTKNVDSYRYQSGRCSDQRLFANAAIRNIVTHVTKLMHEFDANFRVVNVNVLYSKANGEAQGAHMDECRTDEEIEHEGEMVSAIVPLMENTSLDIINTDHRRNRITIPPTMMFIFSGDLLHGGADYKEPNARLHMYFVRGGRIALENTIKIGDLCPHKDCDKHKAGVVYTKTQLRDHWNLHHKVKENMTAGQYAANLEGRLLLCRYCKAYSIGNKGYTRHKKLCHKRADAILKRNVATSVNNQIQEGKKATDKEGWQPVVFKQAKLNKKKENSSRKNRNQAEIMEIMTKERNEQDAEVEVETNRCAKKRKK